MPDPTSLGIGDLKEGLRKRTFSCREVVDAFLHRIASDDSRIGSFLFIDAEGARAAAKSLDERIAEGGDLPHLAGVVVAVKDNIAVRGMPATAASRILEGYVPPYEATVVERLKRAGAIVIGKTNLDEFGMGASTEQSGFHPTANPHDPTRVAGGSSGGSAAAVAAEFCTAALGSDTGGSVRQPAAFCGVVGMRPTYGMVSRNGLIALASSMDVIGPLARSAEDARSLLHVIAGHDARDATSLPQGSVALAPDRLDLKRVRVGVPAEYLGGRLSGEVRAGFERARSLLERAGAAIIDVSLPTTEHAVPTYYVINPAEASSNLGRYDGIRFGQPHDPSLGHRLATAKLRGGRFGSEPIRRILVGSFTLSSGYRDRYYHTAQRVRTLIRQDFVGAFEDVDFLLTPTTPTVAFPLGSVQDLLTMYEQDVYLSAVSLAGLPAISLPVEHGGGLPVGIQLIGQQQRDAELLDVAESLQGIMKDS